MNDVSSGFDRHRRATWRDDAGAALIALGVGAAVFYVVRVLLTREPIDPPERRRLPAGPPDRREE